jgi:hypothetical protein
MKLYNVKLPAITDSSLVINTTLFYVLYLFKKTRKHIYKIYLTFYILF